MLKQLKDLGVQFQLMTSARVILQLSYLHRFPFDVMKIERSFVSRMIADQESFGIVKTITALASELNKSVVAEGIEKQEQHRALLEIGCDYGQGFLFSKPIDAQLAAELLKNNFSMPVADVELLTSSTLAVVIDKNGYEM